MHFHRARRGPSHDLYDSGPRDGGFQSHTPSGPRFPPRGDRFSPMGHGMYGVFPNTLHLNRWYMYAMWRTVHVPVVQLVLTPLISLPPKAKLSQMTISMAIVTVVPHLSLGWWLTHSLVGVVHSLRLFGFRKGCTRDVG